MNFKFPQSFQTAPTLLQKVPPKIRGKYDDARAAYDRADQKTRRLYWLAGLAVLLVIGWIGYNVFFSGGARKIPPPPVVVAEATSGNMDVVEKALGTVIANASVSITARVQGQLVSSGIVEGQSVKKGDLLFQIDPKPYQAAYAQARAALARDQAQAVAANNNRVRYVQLLKQQAISKQQYDSAIANASAMTSTVAADRAALDMAALNLSFTTIRSPIDGKTGTILVQPGNMIPANNPQPLVVINQMQPVKVSFALPQSAIPRLEKESKKQQLEAIIYAHDTNTVIGRAPVTFIGNQVSALSGTIELRATFSNEDLSLVPGQMVDVGLKLEQLKNVVQVPREAVAYSQNAPYVYVLSGEETVMRVGKDEMHVQKAEMRIVEVLNDNGTLVAIKGDVKPGDKIITDGQLRVLPDMPVAIMKPKSPSNGDSKSGPGNKPPKAS